MAPGLGAFPVFQSTAQRTRCVSDVGATAVTRSSMGNGEAERGGSPATTAGRLRDK